MREGGGGGGGGRGASCVYCCPLIDRIEQSNNSYLIVISDNSSEPFT